MSSLEELSLNLENNSIEDEYVNIIWEVLNNLNNLTSLNLNLNDNNIKLASMSKIDKLVKFHM